MPHKNICGYVSILNDYALKHIFTVLTNFVIVNEKINENENNRSVFGVMIYDRTKNGFKHPTIDCQIKHAT
jgi:hypothetical protein